MEIKDLTEGMTASDTPVAIWVDEETEEVIFQYGYASISMPVEDFGDFIDMLGEAWEKLEEE